MTQGAGKYDELCTYVREQAQAAGAIVIITDGNKGMGFSVQLPPDLLATLPDVLTNIAKEVAKDMGVTPTVVTEAKEAKYWRFLMTALIDEEGPEHKTMDQLTEEMPYQADRSKAVEDFIKMVEKAMEMTGHG